jgi:hypothetical protein
MRASTDRISILSDVSVVVKIKITVGTENIQIDPRPEVSQEFQMNMSELR